MRTRSGGFTLVEMLTVCAVVSLIAAILVPNFVRARAQGQLTACVSNISNVARALEMYSLDNQGQYPTSTDVLVPQYLSKIPACPVPGRYDIELQTRPVATYTITCAGQNHIQMGYPENYPQYSASAGLILP